MILLAFAAKAQDKNIAPKSTSKQVIKAKKHVSAEEAKILYEEKYGKQNPDKRKSYSRKDIEENIPEEPTVAKTDEKLIIADKTQPASTNQKPEQPKAIYKGSKYKNESDTLLIKTVLNKPREPVFLEHIEITIADNNHQ